jgi:hypothetical protein
MAKVHYHGVSFTSGGFSMKILRFAIVVLSVSMLYADKHSIDADKDADYSQFHSFVIRQQVINSKKPELKAPPTRRKWRAGQSVAGGGAGRMR